MEKKLRGEVERITDEECSFRELEEGMNTIYLVETENRDYVLKVHTNKKEEAFSEGYKDDQKARFRAEARIYKLVSGKTEAPSPEIVHTDFSEEEVPHQFYIMERIEGENLDAVSEELSTDELEEILFEYGRMLGEIHSSVDLESYGLLVEEDGFDYLEEGNKWPESFRKVIENTRKIIEERWEEPPGLEINSEKLVEVLPEKPSPGLIHSDNRLENVLVQGEEITGFLDWSFTRSGHALYDLARAEYMLIDYDLKLSGRTDEELERFRETLLEGYSRENDLEGYRKYRQVYRYVTVLWIMAGFPNWSSDWDEDRRDSFRRELLERMDAEKP